MAEKKERPIKVVAENRKARFNYAIEDTVEAGIVLTGTEVKSARGGKSTIAESYADAKGGEIWLVNANIPEYQQANRFNHEPSGRAASLHTKQTPPDRGHRAQGIREPAADDFTSWPAERRSRSPRARSARQARAERSRDGRGESRLMLARGMMQ